ncbi:MAG: hypothetical protein WDZ85_01935 [Candidatus Paceibacterota bacterium]
MDSSIFLSQMIGIYLVLIGLVFLFKRKTLMPAMKEVIQSKSLLYIVAMLELAAGIAIVLNHNIWAWSSELLITLFGWLLIVESAAYLLLPYKRMEKLALKFNTPAWYGSCGAGAVIIGAYLIGVGFGLI